MSLILNSYVQKSKWFLYPLLGIKKTVTYKPTETYIADLNKQISENDKCLISVYNKPMDEGFQYFEDTFIFNNYHFKDFYETPKKLVYIFDLSNYSKDFEKFLEGKYSEFSERTKSIINGYFAKHDKFGTMPHPKIKAYLYPDKQIFEDVASELGVDIAIITKLGNIVDKPDLFKETLDIEEETIHESKNQETQPTSDNP
jgi:hypothetical protein